MSYELKPHQADVRIFVKAETLEQLFTDALSGLSKVVYHKEIDIQKLSENQEIEIESIDSTVLLIDFLSEILSLMHQNKTVFCNVEFEQLTESYLKCKVRGFKINGFDEDVKGVTYHEADIQKIDDILQTFIVLDI
jgi:SHS2 domain-containing protein